VRGDVLFDLRGRKYMEIGEKLHNEHLHNLSSLLNIIRIIKSRRMRWEGHVARMEETRYAYRILIGKPQRKRLLERYKQKWYDNIKRGLNYTGWMAWTEMVWLSVGPSGQLL